MSTIASVVLTLFGLLFGLAILFVCGVELNDKHEKRKKEQAQRRAKAEQEQEEERQYVKSLKRKQDELDVLERKVRIMTAR